MSHLKMMSSWDGGEKLKDRLKQHLYISTLIKWNGNGGVCTYYKTKPDLASSCSTLPPPVLQDSECSTLTNTHKVPQCNPASGRLSAKWMIVASNDGSEDKTTKPSLPTLESQKAHLT